MQRKGRLGGENVHGVFSSPLDYHSKNTHFNFSKASSKIFIKTHRHMFFTHKYLLLNEKKDRSTHPGAIPTENHRRTHLYGKINASFSVASHITQIKYPIWHMRPIRRVTAHINEIIFLFIDARTLIHRKGIFYAPNRWQSAVEFMTEAVASWIYVTAWNTRVYRVDKNISRHFLFSFSPPFICRLLPINFARWQNTTVADDRHNISQIATLSACEFRMHKQKMETRVCRIALSSTPSQSHAFAKYLIKIVNAYDDCAHN